MKIKLPSITVKPEPLLPPLPLNRNVRNVISSLLYSGSKFKGHQKSKGNCYDVEVLIQHVDESNSYLCGYLKIKGKFKFRYYENEIQAIR